MGYKLNLDEYIEYLKKKLIYIAGVNAEEYSKAAEALIKGKKYNGVKLPPVPKFLERLVADALRQEMTKNNTIEINDRKGTREVKSIEVKYIDVKEGDTGSTKGNDTGRSPTEASEGHGNTAIVKSSDVNDS